MVQTPRNIIKHELIGLRVSIKEATHKGYLVDEGIIVDETKNTISVRNGDKIKHIPKKCVTLTLAIPDGCFVEVNGRTLAGRSEDRIKKVLKELC